MRHKRVVITHYGGPEVITAVEEDIPTPKTAEVRVKVLATGASRIEQVIWTPVTE